MAGRRRNHVFRYGPYLDLFTYPAAPVEPGAPLQTTATDVEATTADVTSETS